MIEIRQEFTGAWLIGFVVENGKDRVREYLDGLERQHKIARRKAGEKAFREDDFGSIMAALKYFCEHGPSRNTEKFAPEGDGIFAIKHNQERIYGFFAGRHFFACAAGATKKKQKADPELLRWVKGVKRRYEAQQREKGR